MRIVLAWTCAVGLLLAAMPARAAPAWSYRVVKSYPHDPTAFTEGLVWNGGRLIESTGGYSGSSGLFVRELASGRALKSLHLDPSDFGEGVAVVGSQIVQLTWKRGLGYLYDLQLRRTGSFSYSGEGWGLAYDGHSLIRSDGSSSLQWLDPKMFRETRRVTVRDGAEPVRMLNELEFANGLVYANVWLSDRVAVIEPVSGRVRAWVDLTELKTRFAKPDNWNEGDDVLNGIAFNPASGHFYMTGKHWPLLFEIAIDRIPAR